MRKTAKKFLSIVAAATLLGTTVAFASCSDKKYQGDPVTGYDANAAVEKSTNGGFSVVKGDYVYFINGQESYTADNTYGKVVKGSLMRISKADLKSGNYQNAITVIPSLVSSENFDAGIFIYGNYVYYASPTTDKNLKGEVENSWIDLKRAALDGTTSPDDYFFRLDKNTAKFRFVTDGVDRDNNGEEDVFCLYEDTNDLTGKTELRSYNTATEETSVLVAGAKSSIIYNSKDYTDGQVYYTMAVTYHVDSDIPYAATYDQLYTVSASARATVNKDEASYQVEGGRKFDFDKGWMEDQNKDAKDNKQDEPYVFDDYSTFPYVNLGTLVLDGVGSNAANIETITPDSRFNVGRKEDSVNKVGFTYSIARYENGGVYFTRTLLSGGTDTNLYYLSNDRGSAWDTVKANDLTKEAAADIVAADTTKASSTALYEVGKDAQGNRTHTYVYVSGSTLCRADVDGEGNTEETRIARNISSITLWKTEGNYLYYYGTGTNGNNLSRVNYKGEGDVYNHLLEKVNAEYQPITIKGIDWNSSWYKPEFVTYEDGSCVFLYSNAQSYGNGGVAYNYVYATLIGDTAQIKDRNEKYEAVEEYLDEYSSNSNTTNLINYFFRTDLEVEEESKLLYDEKLFEEVSAKFGENGLAKEKDFIGLIGKVKEDDATEMEEAWKNSLLTPEVEEEEEEESLPGWAIALIVVGSVLVVAGLGGGVYYYLKKKKDAKAKEEAIINAYKRKSVIDTTDDKSIDVYADEEETPVEESADGVAEDSETNE